MIGLLLAVAPTGESRICVPNGTAALACATASVSGYDTAESFCGGPVINANCWVVDGWGDHYAQGGVRGSVQVAAAGSIVDGDTCENVLGTCSTSASTYVRILNGYHSSFCFAASASTTATTLGISVVETKYDSC